MQSFSPKAIYWGKVLSKFISIQLFVQTLSFICSILLIRTLDKQQYAYYTIANTMQASMNMLADSGISISLSALGGKVWQDRYRFGQLVNTALQLRNYFAVVVFAVTVPILLWMLIANGASVIYAVCIAAAVLFSVSTLLTVTVFGTVLRLHSQIKRIQRLDLLNAISRLVLLSAAYLTFLNAAVAILTVSISLVFSRLIISRWMKDSIDIKAPVNNEAREAILENTKQRLPNDIFSCVQGQLTIWLISVFGDAKNVAELGALNRLIVIFSIFETTMNAVILPGLARCHSPRVLFQRYWQIISLTGFLGLILIGIATFFPSLIIWILGEQYSNIKNELILMMCSVAFNAMTRTMRSINSTKAWINRCWLVIPFTLTAQAVSLLFLDVSTVAGVIQFGIVSIMPNFFLNIYMTFDGFASKKY
ncbi:polysaccharide biosynthesis protein [Cyanosarcina cf. burmensis CCALA 770]|nr:polysaccharide biosynthesis protein [Cyanosarcina cf. burmensis CCALA 770]